MTLTRPMFPPAGSTRRHFLSQAAGVAAGGTVLALAVIPPAAAVAAPASPLDPVFGLIEAHRTARAAYLVALEEHTRLDRLGDLDVNKHRSGTPGYVEGQPIELISELGGQPGSRSAPMRTPPRTNFLVLHQSIAVI
jgi:hypothetical protein